MYTYNDLLRETEQAKNAWWAQTRKALRGPAGFLVKAEIEKDPGSVAYVFLAREFCEKLAEHIDEWTTDEQGNFDPWNLQAREIGDIYMAYEDGSSDLYDLLPTEARLFDI
jgi:hypothetical protein